jgi:enterochelin esterase family protein
MKLNILCYLALGAAFISLNSVQAQQATNRPAQPTPPTRDPHTAGFVTATELPDGDVPPANKDGNFIIGPTHAAAPELHLQDGVPQGITYEFTMSSAESKIYPGIARDAGTFGKADPNDPAKMIVTTSHPAPYTRQLRSLWVRTGRIECCLEFWII